MYGSPPLLHFRGPCHLLCCLAALSAPPRPDPLAPSAAHPVPITHHLFCPPPPWKEHAILSASLCVSWYHQTTWQEVHVKSPICPYAEGGRDVGVVKNELQQ